jgi:rhamnosyl/mannosyltransferase
VRVLHIGKFYPPFAGGMEYFLADLMTAQKSLGIEAAALVHDHRRLAMPGTDNDDHRDDNRILRVPCYGQLLYAPLSPSFPL